MLFVGKDLRKAFLAKCLPQRGNGLRQRRRINRRQWRPGARSPVRGKRINARTPQWIVSYEKEKHAFQALDHPQLALLLQVHLQTLGVCEISQSLLASHQRKVTTAVEGDSYCPVVT